MFRGLLLAGIFFFLVASSPVSAQSLSVEPEGTDQTEEVLYAVPPIILPEYLQGAVVDVLSQQTIPGDTPMFTQKVKVILENGDTVEITMGSEFAPLRASQLLKAKTKVIVAKETTPEGVFYSVSDVYRLPVVYFVVGLFVIAVISIARWQGLFAVVGMAMSLAVLLQFTVPKILSGSNPFSIALISCVVISFLTLYVAHGWSVKTHIALGSILSILGIIAVLSYLAVKAAHLVGLGSEEAFFLQYGDTAVIDLQGLLLGGILLGALGVLDDIAVSQAAIVFQLADANDKLGFKQLFVRAMNVGRDHIASLVNTLFLAYVGANTALFILFYINEQTPFWVALNSEQIVEEIIRTMVGSLGLVLAVPLTSAIAAVVVVKYRKQLAEELHAGHHGHSH